MDSNLTSPQSEPDQDNSSLQNPSTNPAEAGTTDETRDDDHETSSIEALNWSEVEEEELAASQRTEALAAAAALATSQGKPISEVKVSSKAADEEYVNETNDSSTVNDEGSLLSTSLLQSINSTVSDEDPQARKLSVIENWASEVINARERGEIELQEDFPDDNDNGVTGDDEDDVEENDKEHQGIRKRKGKKLSADMVSSMLSSVSQAESSGDPLSHAPVLDDGPIWNKGPRSYTFQENRRVNQKLTICLLIAIVLAIGLGLGNLVAHQECEAEYKSQQSQHSVKNNEKSPIHPHPGTIPTTTPQTPIIPDRSTDSSTLPNNNRAFPSRDSRTQLDVDKNYDNDDIDDNNNKEEEKPEEENKPQEKVVDKRDEPIIDPKYRVHAETLSKVVHTLDRLSQKIDKFENNTRKLQGVLMIPDEDKEEPETSSETPSALYDEQVYKDDDFFSGKLTEDEEEEEREEKEALIDNLIDAIEQTPNYLEMKKEEQRWKEYDEAEKNRWKEISEMTDGKVTRPNIFARKTPPTKEEVDSIKVIENTVKQFKEFERRFVKSERKKMKEEGKYQRLNWRLPEEYTIDERNALKVRYQASWEEFLKLIKNKVPDPIQELFGDEEEEEERTYDDVFYYPFPNPDLDITEEERAKMFEQNLIDGGFYEAIRKTPEEIEAEKNGIIEDVQEETDETTLEDVNNIQSDQTDDLIVLEARPPPPVEEKMEPLKETEPTSKEENFDGKFASVYSKKVLIKNSVSSETTSETATESIPEVDKTSVENHTSVKREAKLNKIDTTKQFKKFGNKSQAPSKDTGTGESTPPIRGKRSQSGQNEMKNGKREQKQKEQKGKQKVKASNKLSNNNGNVNGAPTSETGKDGKVSGNMNKKLKKSESNNKVSENVKGKGNEKRRGSTVGGGKEKQTATGDKRSSETAGRRSTQGDKSNIQSDKQRNNRPNRLNRNGEKINQQMNSPKHYDSSRHNQNNNNNNHIHRPQNNGRDNGNGGSGSGHQGLSRDNSKLKHENQDFSSREAQYRQQKPEFNTNYGSRSQGQNGGNYSQGKKANNFQNKKSKEKMRERTTAGGN